MPVRDTYHGAVRNALVKEGWIITNDPLRLIWGKRDLYVDLGAHQIVAATKLGQSIAVEVKGFLGESLIGDLERALGQYLIYRSILARTSPQCRLYLAIPKHARKIFREPLGELVKEDYQLQFLVFDPLKEEVVSWTS